MRGGLVQRRLSCHLYELRSGRILVSWRGFLQRMSRWLAMLESWCSYSMRGGHVQRRFIDDLRNLRFGNVLHCWRDFLHGMSSWSRVLGPDHTGGLCGRHVQFGICEYVHGLFIW